MVSKIKYLILFLLTFGCSRYCDDGGLVNGINIEYYENGKVRSRFSTKNCLKEGYQENFYPNGRLKDLGNYHKGYKIGVWKSFDENNFDSCLSTWNNGKLLDCKFFAHRKMFLDNKILNDSTYRILSGFIGFHFYKDSLLSIGDYANVLVFSNSGKVVFSLNKIKDSTFLKYYKLQVFNFEYKDKYLYNGIEYHPFNDMIKIDLYYFESSSSPLKMKQFNFYY